MLAKPSNILPLAQETTLASDLEWLLQSAEVSDAAIAEALLAEHSGRLYRLAFCVFGVEDSARQAVGEAVLQIVTQRHHYWSDSCPEVWLYHEAYRAFQRFGRSRRFARLEFRRRKTSASLADLRDDPSLQEYVRLLIEAARLRAGCALDDADVSRIVEHIRPVMQWLSERYRLAALLRYGEGLSIGETARVMGAELGESYELLCEVRRRVRGLYHSPEQYGVGRNARPLHSEMLEAIEFSVEGLLGVEEQASLDAHLVECPACRQTADCTHATETLLKAYYQREETSNLPQSEIEPLASEIIGRLEVRHTSRRLTRSFKELALGALAVLLVLGYAGFRAVSKMDAAAEETYQAPAQMQAYDPFQPQLPPENTPTSPVGLLIDPNTPTATAASRITDIPEAASGIPETAWIPIRGRRGTVPVSPYSLGSDTLVMVLTYWGWDGDYDSVAKFLQPNPEDVNIMPYELASFVEEKTEYKAVLRFAGNVELLKKLVAAGFPVIVERGDDDLTHSPDWIARYAIVAGYDDDHQRVSLLENDFRGVRLVDYGRLMGSWRAFNYLYIVVYPEEKEEPLMALLGVQADVTYNYEFAAQKASDDVFTVLGGKAKFFSWFNRGVSLTYLDDYGGAALAFDEAFALYDKLPEDEKPTRLMWHQSRPYWAYFYTGQYQAVIDLANETLATTEELGLEESFYWRGLAREALGDVDGAVADLQLALILNPNFIAGKQQLARIKGGS